jgi:hypothetical protein
MEEQALPHRAVTTVDSAAQVQVLLEPVVEADTLGAVREITPAQRTTAAVVAVAPITLVQIPPCNLEFKVEMDR